MKKLIATAAALAVLLAGCSQSGGSETTASGASSAEPGSASAYTAILADRRGEEAATSCYEYIGDITPYQLLNALAAHLGVALSVNTASITTSDIRVDFNSDTALKSCAGSEELIGLLDSVSRTLKLNYGEDKQIYFTVAGEPCELFGITLSGEKAYGTADGGDIEEGDLSIEDAQEYAVNLTYGILGDSSAALSARADGIVTVGDTRCYDVTVYAESDPGSVMRRFAISLDGVEAFVYNSETGAFERF